MQLSMLDTGVAYLSRQQQNRSRMNISHLALGGAINYVPPSTTTAFKTPILYKALIDAQQVTGDTVTFTCILPATLVLSFGEIAVLSPEGGFIAMAVLNAPIVKTNTGQMQLSLSVSASGLGAQMTFTTNKVFLSRTRPDFDDLLLQLQSAAWEKQSWSGLVTNETGTTLLELMAGISEFDAAMFESALQESFSDTAKLDSSQYSIQTMLGNRLTRKAPAGANFTFNRTIGTTARTIPPYTKWTSGGKNLFNRDAISFIAGQTSQVGRLYEGEVVVARVTGMGQDYQFWISGQDDFTVSDSDVSVVMSGTKIPVVYDSLWNYNAVPAVQDKTDRNGSLMLRFGNATLGTRPDVTDTVVITYAITKGNAGNDSSFLGQKAACPSIADMSATATTALTGGGDQPSITLYQRMGGDLFGGQSGSVTPAQYRARAREYPGVLDAVVLAQRDLAPTNKDWFNVGKVILLTQQPWSQADKDAYELWLRKRTMYSMRYQILTGDVVSGEEPHQKVINVRAKVSCRNDADLVNIQAMAEGAVKKLFVPRAGILSRSMYITDITDAIKEVAPELIDFTILELPTTDIGMDIYTPKGVVVTVSTGTGSTLPPGDYVYGIAASDARGSTVPDLIRVTTTAPMSTITFTWDHVPAATGYLVYGRTAPFGLLAPVTDVDGTVPTFVDKGTIVGPGTPPAPINTSGVHYPVLGTLDISVSYSRRRQTEDSAFGQ